MGSAITAAWHMAIIWREMADILLMRTVTESVIIMRLAARKEAEEEEIRGADALGADATDSKG